MRLYELDQKRILAMFEQVEKSLDEFGKRMDIWEEIINEYGDSLEYDVFISECAKRGLYYDV